MHIDPQSAFQSLTTKFENVMINVGGVTDYIPKAFVKIRQIKEIYRGVKSELP